MIQRNKKLVVRGGAAVGLGFVAIQFVRPTLENPPVVADIQAPSNVARILRRACYDCHSNETKLPWFDRVVPPYWLVVKDVREARAHLNFSEVGKLPPPQQKAILFEAINRIRLGSMPPRKYTLIHPNAVVSAEDIAAFEADLVSSGGGAAPPPSKPIGAHPVVGKVGASPGGLAFDRNYPSWTPITTTDRFDNMTMRVILANDVAVRAIADNHVKPWPDGAAFAKVAWLDSSDAPGVIRPGAFKQVELMVKGATKYRDSAGWGWGRWLGENLTAYGDSSKVPSECVSCHVPMEKNDFVYTLPMRNPPADADRFNVDAALSELPESILAFGALTTSIDRNGHTMSTVYANPIALEQARADAAGALPSGAVLGRVTWEERDDPHWFGARIPGKVRSVEIITVGRDGALPFLTTYEGSPLHPSPAASGPDAAARRDALLAEKADDAPNLGPAR